MNTSHNATASTSSRWGRWMLASLFVAVTLSGCAAFHPIRGVPAPYVPPEYLGPSRSGKKTIDLSLLVQTPPDEYRVAAGDTLSVYIPGVLGSLNVEEDRQIGETPPINLSSNPNDPPTIGYPITVRDDGTIALPYVDPINVHAMTLPQIETVVRKAYTEQSNILNGERDRVLVSLQRRREVSVIVVRQETSSELTQGAQSGTLNIGNSKRGTARTVRLPAYENDVLHALANSQQGSDGLPGLDAKNTIYIIRRKKSASKPSWDAQAMMRPTPTCDESVPTVMESTQPPVLHGLPVHPAPMESRHLAPSTPGAIVAPPTPPTPTHAIETPPQTLPATPVPQRETAPPQTRPEPVPQQSQPAPLPTAPQESPVPSPSRPPVWPAPAQPAPSIQRTSGQRSTTQAPAAWPTIRGQSPNGWIWGHSNTASLPADDPSTGLVANDSITGGPTAPLATFGHGSFGPSSSPQTAQLTAPMANSGFSPYAAYPPAQPMSASPRNAGTWSAPPVGHPSVIAASPTEFGGHGVDTIGGHDNAWQAALSGFDPTVDNPNVIKIPIRLADGERPTFTERDIILEDGDIVFIESRETEVFYTGGLLGGGQYTLPRDYDLRVLEAISIAQSPRTTRSSGRAIGGVSALNQDVTISASHVIILRTLLNGTRIPIEVDLYKAVRRPQENLLIQPSDLIILQYTKIEAIGAFLERHLLEGALFGVATAQLNNNGGGGNGN